MREVKGINVSNSVLDFVLVCRSACRIQHVLFQIFKRAGFHDVNTRVRNGAFSSQSVVVAITVTELSINLLKNNIMMITKSFDILFLKGITYYIT